MNSEYQTPPPHPDPHIPPQMNMVIPILMHFCSLISNMSVASRIKTHVVQKGDLINDVKLFPAVYRRIYCHKYLTLSNQTSRYKSKCIRIYLFYLFLRFPVPFFTVVILLRKIGSRHLFRC